MRVMSCEDEQAGAKQERWHAQARCEDEQERARDEREDNVEQAGTGKNRRHEQGRRGDKPARARAVRDRSTVRISRVVRVRSVRMRKNRSLELP